MSSEFTQVPNSILEIAPRFKFSAAQFSILLVIWRYTYGFHRDDHDFAISFLAQATGMDGRNVRRELNGLLDARVLLVTQQQTNKQARRIGINQNYNDWVIEMRDSGKGLERANLTSQIEFGEGYFDLSGGGESDLSGEGGFDPQEIKYLKKDLNKNIYVEIIDYLNMKTGKRFSPKVKSNRDLINGRLAEGRTLDDFLYVIDVKCSQWLGNGDMEQYLRPSTLFRPSNFENYLNERMPSDKKATVANSRDKDVAFQQWIEEGNDPNEFDWS